MDRFRHAKNSMYFERAACTGRNTVFGTMPAVHDVVAVAGWAVSGATYTARRSAANQTSLGDRGRSPDARCARLSRARAGRGVLENFARAGSQEGVSWGKMPASYQLVIDVKR